MTKSDLNLYNNSSYMVAIFSLREKVTRVDCQRPP